MSEELNYVVFKKIHYLCNEFLCHLEKINNILKIIFFTGASGIFHKKVLSPKLKKIYIYREIQNFCLCCSILIFFIPLLFLLI